MNNITVLDNFYPEPQKVVDMLTGEYPISGCGTGNRSLPLQQMNPRMYSDFCNAIFSIHGINGRGLKVSTFFMEHESSAIDIFNQKWIHIDGKNPDVCMMSMQEYKLILCGQIFLTPDPDPEAGTKICTLKPTVNWTEKQLIENCIDNYTLPRQKYDAGMINLDEYVEQHNQYHSNFDLTCDVKNVYNRMVSWKAGTLHGDPITKKMPKRLNQYFFVERN
jgi:hypothetical protein